MRPLRYSINVTLDGCCDHRACSADEALHRHAVENLTRADALLFGRVTYEMMEAAFRPPASTGERPDWTEPFARTIDAAPSELSGTVKRAYEGALADARRALDPADVAQELEAGRVMDREAAIEYALAAAN